MAQPITRYACPRGGGGAAAYEGCGSAFLDGAGEPLPKPEVRFDEVPFAVSGVPPLLRELAEYVEVGVEPLLRIAYPGQSKSDDTQLEHSSVAARNQPEHFAVVGRNGERQARTPP